MTTPQLDRLRVACFVLHADLRHATRSIIDSQSGIETH